MKAISEGSTRELAVAEQLGQHRLDQIDLRRFERDDRGEPQPRQQIGRDDAPEVGRPPRRHQHADAARACVIEQMKEWRFGARDRVRIVDDQRGGVFDVARIEAREVAPGQRARAGEVGEDGGEMGLSRAGRPDQQHQRGGPARPRVDQRQGGGVRGRCEKVIAGEARFVRQRQRQLPGRAHELTAVAGRPR